MKTKKSPIAVNLSETTALVGASQHESVLLVAQKEQDASLLALASGVAIAAGHCADGPMNRGWSGPVAVVSSTQTTTALRASVKELAGIFGEPQEAALRIVGADELRELGFAYVEGALRFGAHSRAIAAIIGETGARLVVLDFPEDFYVTLEMAQQARRANVAVLATTGDTLDRPGQSVFAREMKLDTDEDGAPILRYMRPGTGHGRPLTLSGLLG